MWLEERMLLEHPPSTSLDGLWYTFFMAVSNLPRT